MSKCDIHIAFDKSDRQFRPGDTVVGKVILGVNKNVTCRGVKVCGRWKTHGRGNQDSDDYHEQNLFEGELKDGESYEFPFSFPTPAGPLTYRGKLINVDHYARVQVDIPWALDPKHEEEFILLPGPSQVSRTAQPFKSDRSAAHSQFGRYIMGFLAFAVIAISMFGFALGHHNLWLYVAIIAAIIMAFAFRGLRKTLAERRLGRVDVQIESTLVAPGQNVPIRLSFTPTRRGRISAVTAQLTGREQATSGSGTNKSVHRHSIHQRKVVLAGPGEFVTGKMAEFSGTVPIPETDAFSFASNNNEIHWTLDLRIDIPRWPDWVDSTIMELVPAEELGGQTEKSAAFGSPAAAAKIGKSFTQAVDAQEQHARTPPLNVEPMLDLAPSETAGVERTASPDSATSPTLLEAIGLLAKLDGQNDERERIIEAIKQDRFEVSVVVQRIVTSYERFADPAYDGGKTITGVIPGTDQSVQVNLPRTANERVEALRSGDAWRGRVRVSEWDSLHRRLELLGDA